jgi:hypothetical protein
MVYEEEDPQSKKHHNQLLSLLVVFWKGKIIFSCCKLHWLFLAAPIFLHYTKPKNNISKYQIEAFCSSVDDLKLEDDPHARTQN